MFIPTFDSPTHAKPPAFVERASDTPERLAGAPPVGHSVSLGAQDPPLDLALPPPTVTGGTGSGARPVATRPAARVAEDPLERLQHVRLTLLRRAESGEQLSVEDEARYAYATERLDRLFPRVSAEDFERLADAGDELAGLNRELEELKNEFRAAHPTRRKRSRR